MVIRCSLPVALSLADTFRMPFASMSNVTSTCGTPRGAGRMPSRMKRPSDLFSAAIGRSPCRTWISTLVWSSDAVEKVSVLLGRDRRVARDQRRHHAAQRLDAQRQRRDVEQQDVLDLALQHARLDRRADRDDLVRVDALVRLLAEDLLTFSCTAGMRVWPPTSTTSSIWLGRHVGVLQRLRAPARPVRSTRSPTSCSSLARVRVMVRCFGPLASAVMNGRLISVCCVERQLDLGLLGGFLQPLEGHAVLAQVDALLLLELVADPVDDALVEVVAAQVGVAVGRHRPRRRPRRPQDRDVERAAAQVVDGDRLFLALLVEAVGQRPPRSAR